MRREGRSVPNPDRIKEEQEAREWEQKFWCLATQAEAYFGLGELVDYEKKRSAAEAPLPRVLEPTKLVYLSQVFQAAFWII